MEGPDNYYTSALMCFWIFRDIPAVPLLHVSCGYCRLHMSNLKMKQ